MLFRQKIVLLIVLLFVLSGCYRQAGESLEPITNPTATPPTAEVSSEQEDDTILAPDILVTPTIFPAVTIITNPNNGAEPTKRPPTQNPLTPSGAEGLTTNETPTFITPGAPSGPIVIDTATPTVAGAVAATPSGLITPTAFVNTNDPCIYVVQGGDNMFRIAVNHNVTLDELMAANPEVVPERLQPGQTLQIPNCIPGVSSNTTTDTTTDNTNTITTTDLGVSGQQIHTVAAGETLWTISQRYGVTVADIIQANSLNNPDALSVGQQLIIPSG